eukprot:TRINITY_DN3557_c0_g1_i2.p1 TRINITY_DN3557_c0_g1~~TRINITY_DN3557_c0_g1_i2.p1  ORF type:complete len:181 (-),score=31.60 TRINITY_DN3557_c0_g1_i2:16-558(-)
MSKVNSSFKDKLDLTVPRRIVSQNEVLFRNANSDEKKYRIGFGVIFNDLFFLYTTSKKTAFSKKQTSHEFLAYLPMTNCSSERDNITHEQCLVVSCVNDKYFFSIEKESSKWYLGLFTTIQKLTTSFKKPVNIEPESSSGTTIGRIRIGLAASQINPIGHENEDSRESNFGDIQENKINT